jgi:hypothetical protein
VLVVYLCALSLPSYSADVLASSLIWHEPAPTRRLCDQSLCCLRRYLQSREIEYMMGVNTLYETQHFHIIGSFKRAFVHTRVRLSSTSSRLPGHVCIFPPLVVLVSCSRPFTQVYGALQTAMCFVKVLLVIFVVFVSPVHTVRLLSMY